MSHATALTGNSDGVSQTVVVTSFVREEVDGEDIRQQNLPVTFQVDRRTVVTPFNCLSVSDICIVRFTITE